jgi:hypothetical protein
VFEDGVHVSLSKFQYETICVITCHGCSHIRVQRDDSIERICLLFDSFQ